MTLFVWGLLVGVLAVLAPRWMFLKRPARGARPGPDAAGAQPPPPLDAAVQRLYDLNQAVLNGPRVSLPDELLHGAPFRELVG
jgi:hypothetical protein